MQLTFVVPVNVSFPSAPNITLPNGATIALAWQRCVPAGCFAALRSPFADFLRLSTPWNGKLASLETERARGNFSAWGCG